MALSYKDETMTDSSTSQFDFTFPYLDAIDVRVKYDLVEIPQDQTTVTTSPSTKIQVYTNSDKDEAYPAASGQVVRIYRVTDQDPARVDFVDGSVLTGDDLDAAIAQLLYIAQESYDQAIESLQKASGGIDKWDGQDKILTNIADATGSSDAVTKAQMESSILSGTGTTPQCIEFAAGIAATEIGGPATEITKTSFTLTSTEPKRMICTVGGVYQRPDTDFDVAVVGDGFKLTIKDHIASSSTLDYPVSLQITY